MHTLRFFFCFLSIGLVSASLSFGQSVDQPMNVLFIAVDDLRPELNSYGASHIVSPNIDRLAAEGLRFDRAYCQVPVCGASRASLLSGVRPTRDRFVNYMTRLDDDLPGVTSLPGFFKQSGYTTISNGKIYHHRTDDVQSWDNIWFPSPSNSSRWRDYLTPINIELEEAGVTRGLPYEKADVDDDAYFDGKIAAKSIEDLRKLKEQGSPFFLAVGFRKPHLPFNAPARYWDLYSREDIQLADNPFAPEGAPAEAMHKFGELRAYAGIPAKGPVGERMARNLVHGYQACVSYTDAQVGRLLDELDRLGLRENTIVILWGDHGWHLGEHGLWCKHCNFEKVMHVPMILSAPGYQQGMVAESMVEFVDIYPTLADLTDLPAPAHLQGESLVPLLEDPSAPFKDAAFSRWFDGETVITERYIYTEWMNEDRERYARMLYDLKADPGENLNVAERPENAALVEELSALIDENYTRTLDLSI